jgi:hypothetical protein
LDGNTRKGVYVMRLASCIIAALALLLPTLASAGNPCSEDAKRFCADVDPGQGRIVKCLQAHKAELSQKCRAFGKKVRKKLRKGLSQCKGDVAQFCKEVKPGQGRIAQCLAQNKGSLSDACKGQIATTVKKVKRHARGFRKACGADVKAHCKGVKPGKGRILACLAENKDAVSDGCKALLSR